MGTKTVNENVNTVAENAVLTFLDNLFKDIAYIDVTTVRRNIGYASEGGMSKSDRIIKADVADYCMRHFATIYLGLVVAAPFREEFIKAIQLEMGLDKVSPEKLAGLRKQMKLDDENAASNGKLYLIDLSSYNDAVYTKINKKIYISMKSMAEFDEGFDEYSSRLTQNDMINLGFIVSNFMYLLRAISNNELFVDYMKTFIREVEAKLES